MQIIFDFTEVMVVESGCHQGHPKIRAERRAVGILLRISVRLTDGIGGTPPILGSDLRFGQYRSQTTVDADDLPGDPVVFGTQQPADRSGDIFGFPQPTGGMHL